MIPIPNDLELLQATLTELGVKHYTYSGVSEARGIYCCLVIADPNSDEAKQVPLFTFNVDKKLIDVGTRYICP